MANSQGINHILVLVDGTESSFHAVDCVIDLAKVVEARVTALAIVDTETLHQLLSVRILVDAEMGELEEQLAQTARNYLDDVLDRAQKKGLTVESVLTSGDMETIVPKEIVKRKVDLAVIGTFQSSEVRHDLLARHRQQILDHSPCSVLVVH